MSTYAPIPILPDGVMRCLILARPSAILFDAVAADSSASEPTETLSSHVTADWRLWIPIATF